MVIIFFFLVGVKISSTFISSFLSSNYSSIISTETELDF